MKSLSSLLSCHSTAAGADTLSKSIDVSSFGLGISGVADHRQHGLGISAPRDGITSIALAY